VASRPQRQKSKVSAFLSDFRDLQVGDYVVHVEHGIGQYQGLKEINQGDGNAEFMLLEYAEGARLYVPLTRLDLIQKYRSSEGAKPAQPSGHAGHGRGAAQALRRAQGGAGPRLQRRQRTGSEFEDAFEFNETEDQARRSPTSSATWNRATPMDRLLCGDVGYGKTEVAMRAAFKAVMDGKQVAVLAPTTVLAFQHYEDAFKRALRRVSRSRSR
jgi:transcription-repair coupling factor (superfamily II helicase)